MFKQRLTLTLSLLLLCVTAHAQPTAAECRDFCEPPATQTNTIVVDASTNTQLIRRFPQETSVEFIIINKNPFKYQYRTEIVGLPLADAIAAGFLSKIAGLDFNSALGLASGSACASNAQVVALEDTIARAETIANTLAASLTARADSAKTVAQFLADTDKDSIKCPEICSRATDVRPHVSVVTESVAPLETKLTELQKAIDAADAQFAAAKPSVAAMAAGSARIDCENAVNTAEEGIKKLKEAIKTITVGVGALKDAQAPAKQMGTIIDSLNSSSFVEVQRRDVGETSYDFGLFRRDLRAKDAEEEKIAAITADVGTSPISISGGVGFTTVEDVTIVSQKAPDPTDATKTINVFAEENTSSLKPTPVMMLNANLAGRKARMLFSWSLGVALVSRNDTTQTEYITGPSLGFLDNRVLLSLGYHAARVAKLGGGFKPGQQIPAGLVDNLPVVHQWEGGFMFAVSYRIR